MFISDEANFSGTYLQVPLTANSAANAAAGNYIVFTGLTADSFLLRTEEISGGQVRAQINGIQIVAVPEPGTASSMTLLGLMVVAAHRRRSVWIAR